MLHHRYTRNIHMHAHTHQPELDTPGCIGEQLLAFYFRHFHIQPQHKASRKNVFDYQDFHLNPHFTLLLFLSLFCLRYHINTIHVSPYLIPFIFFVRAKEEK